MTAQRDYDPVADTVAAAHLSNKSLYRGAAAVTAAAHKIS